MVYHQVCMESIGVPAVFPPHSTNALRDNGAPEELLKRLFPEFQAVERK
jgi:hypothetical protein